MKPKLEKVPLLTRWRAVVVSVSSILVTLIIFSILLLWEGVNPLEAYSHIFDYALNPQIGLATTIYMGTFLLFNVLAFLVPLKAGIWNIGTPGQWYLGTVGAFAVAYAWGDLPSGVLIPLMLIVAAIFGASYGAIIGFLRGKLGVNEIVVAIMLNWIAYWLVYTLVVGGPWMGIAESQSRPLPTSAWAPMIWEVPFTVFLVLGISVILYFLFLKSKIGYQIRTLGSGPFAAEHAGMSPLKITILVMAVGGALAGLSGYHSWAGHIAFRLIPRPEAHLALGEFTFYGILVGLLCLLNPLTAIPLSIFIGTLRVGSEALVSRLGLPFGLHHVFLGILFLTFVIFQFFYRYKIVWVKKGG